MKKLSTLLIATFAAFAEMLAYSTGHTSFSWVDATRNNRNVPVEAYYPANAAGENVAISNGIFPVIAFGHGFVMGYDSYENIWTALVGEGYIVLMLNTETSFSPSHADFGKDLAFAIDQMILEGNNSNSLFLNAVSTQAAVMGHSMGGGSSFLAISNSPNIDAMVTLAPAETNPSAVAASSSINIPSLIIAGANDCVAPLADHQQLMQDALNSSCKTLAIINGASHCQFANYNLTCNFGELTCGTPATISETEQHDATNALIIPWLNFYLKNDCAEGTHFQENLANNATYNAQQNCSLLCTSIPQVDNDFIEIFPVPASGAFCIKAAQSFNKLTIINDLGQNIHEQTIMSNNMIDCHLWQPGLYFVMIQNNDGKSITRRIIIE
jgi:dienelactone hydrolase